MKTTTPKHLILGIGLALSVAGGAAPARSQAPVRIFVGTAAPEGSIWEEILEQMRQDWTRIAGDAIDVRIYAGGTQGDEAVMLDKVRLGSRSTLQAVGLSGAGLTRADKGIAAMQIPLMYESWEEFDYVFDRLRPVLEDRLEAAGFVVLNWAPVGWVQFFTKEPARTPEDIRGMRLFTTAGDPEAEALWRAAHFQPVPLAVTEMITNLNSGVIDAFDVPPLFALADQSVGLVHYMLDLKWAPLVGATLVSKETWEQVPDEYRHDMLEAARQAADFRRADILRSAEDSVEVLRQQDGFTVTPVDAALLAVWHEEVEPVWPTLRGGMVPADLFDRAFKLRDEFREPHD
jgi:TRAP-type transport system periplasmic protein